jgi:hypothetical protein
VQVNNNLMPPAYGDAILPSSSGKMRVCSTLVRGSAIAPATVAPFLKMVM